MKQGSAGISFVVILGLLALFATLIRIQYQALALFSQAGYQRLQHEREYRLTESLLNWAILYVRSLKNKPFVNETLTIAPWPPEGSYTGIIQLHRQGAGFAVAVELKDATQRLCGKLSCMIIPAPEAAGFHISQWKRIV